MNAICLIIDRLHSGYVGAYGNSWIETPALDRLASQSLVFDRALVDSPELERLYRSYWQGWHAMCPPPHAARPGLAALLREAGVTTALLTDEPQVARHSLAVDFDELIEIDPPWQPQTAASIDETHFARCFMQAINWLESARGPFMLWCHLAGLGTTWDAPLNFRHAYCEEGDPQPPDGADVPERMLPPDYDPDELLGVTQSYSGQVTLFDTCLGALLEFLDGLPAGHAAQETLLTLTSPRGFPLGEHLRVGPCDNALYGELVHVPWLMRFPGRKGVRNLLCETPSGSFGKKVPDTFSPTRSQALIEPADLWATLLDGWNAEGVPHSPTAGSLLPIVRQESKAIRDRLCILGTVPEKGVRNLLCETPSGSFGKKVPDTFFGGVERAIRTPAWHLRVGGTSVAGVNPRRSGTPCLTNIGVPENTLDVSADMSGTECLTYAGPELFAKPDDRWEVNNVALRCREVVECLRDAMLQYELTLPAGRVSELPPLSDVLLTGLD